jgi:hypothetical protein
MSETYFNNDPTGSQVHSPAPSVATPGQDFNDLLHNLNDRLQSLESRMPSSTISVGPKISLPDKYDGRIGRMRDFLISIENIFALQPGRYNSDEFKTRFVGTLLNGTALSWFRDIVLNRSYLLGDYRGFMLDFKNLFDDPNAHRHARKSLKKLVQGKGSVRQYATTFRNLAAETGYNEVALVEAFESGLNDEVQDFLSRTIPRPTTLAELIDLTVLMDQQLYDRRRERGDFKSKFNPGFTPYRSTTSNYKGGNSTPMDLDAMDLKDKKHFSSSKRKWDNDVMYVTDKRGFKHISPVEKKRRIAEKLCLYCGDPGHELSSCPKRKDNKALNMLELSIADNKGDLPIYLPISLKVRTKGITYDVAVSALLDSGATSNFISENLVRSREIDVKKLDCPVSVRLADGRSVCITEYLTDALIEFKTDNSCSLVKQCLMIVPNLKYPVVLGTPWLRVANPTINWKTQSIVFNEETQGDFSLKERSSDHLSTLNNRTCIQKELNNLDKDPPPDRVPNEYLEFREVFNDPVISSLPPVREADLQIVLKDEDKKLPFLKIYNLSRKEEIELKKWIDSNLEKGLIKPSKSPAAAPIFFVSKKDGGLRPCIDYRQLNENTVKDKFPLPLVSDVLAGFKDAKIFTKLDLKGAYNLVRIRSGDEWKCAFRCKFGHFEPLVVQFGLTNAPAVFQRFVNSLFQDLIDIYVVIYLDDILIFSTTVEEHQEHVREVMKRLRDNSLVLKKEKCEFHVKEVVFLGFVISDTGIKMEKEKTQAISRIEAPKTVKQVRSFIGMINFYRKFIHNFSLIAAPLTKLTKKNVPFVWDTDCAKAFETLKLRIVEDVVLKHPDFSREFCIFTDASDFAVGSVLTQDGKPVEFFSRKLLDAELNYSVFDKELLAIVDSLKQWRHLLIHSEQVVTIFSDHNNLRYFSTMNLLKPRHARWVEYLSQYTFRILHIKGKDNVVADFLSRSYQWAPQKQQKQVLSLEGKVLKLNAIEEPTHEWPEDVARYLDHPTNQWSCGIHKIEDYRDEIKHFKVIGNKLYYCDKGWLRLYLPPDQRQAMFRKYHDQTGHLGFLGSVELYKRRAYWPTLEGDLKEYIKSCPVCQITNTSSRGLAPHPTRPLPPLAHPFERLGIDFLQALPESKLGNKNCITLIDYATRFVVAKPVPTMDADEVVKFLYSDVIMKFGCPFEIISDRGGAFCSETVQEFLSFHSIKHLLTSPYHPQTNGMVERMHRELNKSIRSNVFTNTNRWDEFVLEAVFNQNVKTHGITKFSPFRLLFGIEPRLPQDILVPRQVRAPADDSDRLNWKIERSVQDLEDMGQNRAAALYRSRRQAEEWTKDQEAPGFKFQIGQMVKRRRFNAEKFEQKWTGPYFIVDLGPPFTYWLQDADGVRLQSVVNESHLLPWIVRSDSSKFSESSNLVPSGLVVNEVRELEESPVSDLSTEAEEGDTMNFDGYWSD